MLFINAKTGYKIMNEEELRNFNEALRMMSESLRKTGADLGDLSANLKALPGVFKQVTASANEKTKAEQANTAAEQENTNVTKANSKAKKELESAIGAMQSALGAATRSAFSFANALLSPEKNFAKFGGAIDGAADSLSGIANEFGILGKIVGAAIKAQAELSKAHLKQADDMYRGIDAINKMGAAGTMTVKGFTEMAHKVGYTSAELDKLTKPIESMKGGLISLGGIAGKGVKTFMELADVGEQTRRKFRNLGISQEELTQSQADYISLQRMSGKAISEYSKTTGQLKKDSLDYTKNLVELAALTGKSVEEAKKEQAAAQATFAMQVRNAKDASEIAKLDKIIKSDASASDKAAAKERLAQIEQERKVREKMTDSLTKSGLDITQIESFQTFLETGAKTEEFAKAFGSLQGLDVDDIRRRLLEAQKTGADTTAIMAEFETKYRDGVLKNVDRFGKNMMITGEQAARDLGVTSKNLTTSVARAGTDIGEAGKEVKDNIADAEKGKAGGEEDKMQKARNDLYEKQIREAVALDKMLLSTNPIAEGAFPALLDVSKKFYDILMKVWNLLEKFWPVLAALFAGVAAFKIGKWAKTTADSLKDAWAKLKGFGKGGPPVPPSGPAAPGAPGAPGAPKAGEILGKDGKPLRGAALKSAQEKAARVAAEEASKKAAQEAAEAAAKKSAGGMAGKAAGALGKAAGAVGKFARFIPGVGTALSVGMGAYDAYKGFSADKDASLGERLKNAGSSALSGATFGLLGSSPEEIAARKAEKAAATPTKATQDPFAKLMSPEALAQMEEAKKRIADNNKLLLSNEELKKQGLEVATATGMQTAESAKKQVEEAKKLTDNMGMDLSTLGIDVTAFGDRLKVTTDVASLSEKLQKDVNAELEKTKSGLSANNKEFDTLNAKLKDTGPATDKMMKDVTKNVETNTTSIFSGFSNLFSGWFGKGKTTGTETKAPDAKILSVAQTMGSGASASRSAASSSGGGAGRGVISAPASGGGGAVGGAVTMPAMKGQGGTDGPTGPDVESQVAGGTSVVKDQTQSGASAAHGQRKKTEGLIVHHTGGRGLQTAIDTLKTRGLGYHYLVDRDGSVVNYVDDGQVAWHAGKTDKKPDLTNKNSVSLSLVAKDDKDLTKAQAESAIQLGQQLMSKYGISSVYGHGETSSHKHAEEGKTVANLLRGGGKLPDNMPQAAMGGILSGPASGFPAMLHGNEIVVPLDPNSLLAELGKKSKVEIENEAQQKITETKSITSTSDVTKEMFNMNQALMEMLATKLDNMINKLDTSNDTQEKILKYSQA